MELKNKFDLNIYREKLILEGNFIHLFFHETILEINIFII